MKRKNFIDWAIAYVDDESNFAELSNEIIADVLDFLAQDKAIIKRELRKKLEKASKEYKSTRYLPEQVRDEINQEHIDLIGWRLIDRYEN